MSNAQPNVMNANINYEDSGNENSSDKQLSLPMSTSEQSDHTKDMQQANEALKQQLTTSNQQLQSMKIENEKNSQLFQMFD